MNLLDSREPLVLAHRGDSRAAPENTRPAFESALNLGVDLVELDYHESADGVSVVFHDEELDHHTDACARWGGQNILLAGRTWSDLSQLDAGQWRDESFRGTRLMTLDEALRLICPRAGCMIERKSGEPAALAALIERLGYAERCVVTAFDWEFLARCRAHAPSMALGALGTEPLTERRLSDAQRAGAQVIGWDNDFVTAKHVSLVHSRRLKAWVWTVDDVSRAAELIDWGVDGLISNVPRVMIDLVARRAGRDTAP